MLRVTKKKLLEFDSVSSTDNGTVAPPNTPAVKTARKKATPKTRSTAKGKATKKRKVASDSNNSDMDEDSPIKKKTVVKSEPIAEEDSEAGVGAGADSKMLKSEATLSFAVPENAFSSTPCTSKIDHNGKME